MQKEHQEFHGDDAGEVLVKKAGTDQFVKMKDLPHQDGADDGAADEILDRHMREDAEKSSPKD